MAKIPFLILFDNFYLLITGVKPECEFPRVFVSSISKAKFFIFLGH